MKKKSAGRPFGTFSENPKTERVMVRFTKGELKLIKERASVLNLKPSTYCRKVIVGNEVSHK